MTKVADSGKIVTFYAGVATVEGLVGVSIHEVLNDKNGEPAAVVIGFTSKHVEALFIDEKFNIAEPVYASGHPFSISVSDAWLGRVVDGLGRPIDEFAPIPEGKEMSVFLQAPPIIHRKPITRPLITGIKIIDATLPLGRGQRELIIGDRKLGKSTIATDIVLNQKNAEEPVYCIYVLCGQRTTKLVELKNQLEKNNATVYTTVVAALASDSYLAQYLAPFVGCTLAEHFRNTGRDALIVYDDLSKHAKVYRDISLVLKRVPGRETYPGDVFALHATLLERAAQLSDDQSGGSLTALPIVETLEGDITAFIPTNIISITDGQIYLEHGLFRKKFLPAVNVGLSVSRVGAVVQPPVLKSVLGGIRLALAQHKELQKLSQLETVVSEEARVNIHRGDLLLKILTQPKHTLVTYPEQTVLFYAVENGHFDDLVEEEWADFMHLFLDLLRSRYQKVLGSIASGVFDDELKETIKAIVADFKEEFVVQKKSV
ncbi:MAG: F0F1 ATP synthase subunit alpha [Candidatus Nomurabacteria bacterium]|nr:F0F1 ATP synthase subunit alpha [Candidatus Nomurabacteria bacterium]USN87749.1 MAG: F0F1 ATP synthase subunit alpha [Candidatus Nomurabacteria bacterium]